MERDRLRIAALSQFTKASAMGVATVDTSSNIATLKMAWNVLIGLESMGDACEGLRTILWNLAVKKVG